MGKKTMQIPKFEEKVVKCCDCCDCRIFELDRFGENQEEKLEPNETYYQLDILIISDDGERESYFEFCKSCSLSIKELVTKLTKKDNGGTK